MESLIFYDPTPANAGHSSADPKPYQMRTTEENRAHDWRQASMNTAYSTYQPQPDTRPPGGPLAWAGYIDYKDMKQEHINDWWGAVHAAPEWEVQAQGLSPEMAIREGIRKAYEI